MPIIRREDVAGEPLFPGIHSHPLVRPQAGAVSLTVNELVIQPGASVPLHVHPTHEEAMVVLEGQLDARLGDQRTQVSPGAAILAPKEVPHMLTNRGRTPARILAIFPVATPQRQLVEDR
ncbi:MAG: cupin domain-containing protein [SAR202 cluster bacterium]|nr:cupin domain-containing protein [SAR202 cluster bacterium]